MLFPVRRSGALLLVLQKLRPRRIKAHLRRAFFQPFVRLALCLVFALAALDGRCKRLALPIELLLFLHPSESHHLRGFTKTINVLQIHPALEHFCIIVIHYT